MLVIADTRQLCTVLETDTASLRIPTRLEWVGKTADFLRHRADVCGVCDNGRGDNLLIVLHEALTNAIVHGNLGISSALKEQPGDAFARALAQRSADPALADRQVTVTFDYDGRRCQISIADEGEGFDWEKWLASASAEPSDDEAPSMAPSGRGIIIMRAFLDDLHYRRGGREAVLTLNAPHHDERRVAPRKQWSEPVRVAPMNDRGEADWQSAWTALSRDVSETGLALIQTKGHTARRVLVELEDGGRAVYVPAEVCRVTTLDDGLVHIGCRFGTTGAGGAAAPARDASADAAINQVLERVEQQAGRHHRRAHPRVTYTAEIQVRLEGAQEMRSAFSRDLSRGGMAFVTSFEVPHGPIELHLPLQGTTPAPVLRARVVRCQRVTAGVFDIGCQFL